MSAQQEIKPSVAQLAEKYLDEFEAKAVVFPKPTDPGYIGGPSEVARMLAQHQVRNEMAIDLVKSIGNAPAMIKVAQRAPELLDLATGDALGMIQQATKPSVTQSLAADRVINGAAVAQFMPEMKAVKDFMRAQEAAGMLNQVDLKSDKSTEQDIYQRMVAAPRPR